DLRYKRKYEAQNGSDGSKKRCSGKDGEDLVIRVPRGTLIRDYNTKSLIKDLSDGEPFIAARGGNGGFGNARFATPTRQTPHFAKSGQKGQALEVLLELKLIADVGLLGFPNVGKSTLLSVISSASPKIANYHFTTLTPNLGVVSVTEGASFVAADIPGIIEGASGGAGLGHDFLRHIERCRLLIHIVDASGSEGRDPVSDFETINRELREYSGALAERPQIIAANKTDILYDTSLLEKLKEYAKERSIPLYEISAATRAGVPELILAVWKKLQTLPPVLTYEPEYVPEPEDDRLNVTFDISVSEGVYTVEGPFIERVLGSVNFDDLESRMYFERVLRNAGLFGKLEEMGIQEGDTVSIAGFQFDYVK
ncbi:MAG: GTPase ObgE, partial [Bacillota bacterium]|nr:GTPase ObgE [Bacillota bacterium]